MSHEAIEYFYSAHSAFAYIGSRRVMEIAAKSGCRLIHRPIHLKPVITAVGGKGFHERTKQHVDYFFGREIERWANFRDVAIISFRPTFHDEDMTLPSRLLIAAKEGGQDVDRLAHLILEAHWKDDADISRQDTLTPLIASIGINPDTLTEKAASPHIHKIYEENTREAIERSVFGSPTYFLNGDMYYGQDHLELLEQALTA